MIRSFRHKGLEVFFRTGSTRGIQPKHAVRLRLQLAVLDSAKSSQDLMVPGWRFHELTGRLKGHYSLSVDKNWRLTFRMNDSDVVVLDYQDYH
jgi:proteic killer suppression protein